MKKQYGLSLVELMISITLGLMLMAGVVQMFISTKSSHASQQSLSRIQETGRMAMEFIGRDLRMASVVGCVRMLTLGKTTPNVINPSNYDLGGMHRNFLVGLVGFDSPTALAASGVTLAQAIGSMTPAANSDILVIRGATDRGFPLVVNNTANTLTVFRNGLPIINNCIGGLCQGGAAVVSDCDSGRIFKINTLATTVDNLTITHNENWDLSINPGPSVYEAIPETLVYPMHTFVYFVAPGVSGEPSLWQRTDRDNALELVEGVERIQFTYRTSNSAVASFVAASTLSAADWEDVEAVRVDMVIRGAEANALESEQSYTFPGDAAATTPGDRRLRQLFSNTFSIRTR